MTRDEIRRRDESIDREFARNDIALQSGLITKDQERKRAENLCREREENQARCAHPLPALRAEISCEHGAHVICTDCFKEEIIPWEEKEE